MTKAEEKIISPIAHIRTDFPEKFGIPRQAGVAPDTMGAVVFEDGYDDPNMVRGLDGFSHIWLIWGFSEHEGEEWPVTVRPPRLGGEKRVGVLASRSPYRPNGLGLSVIKLLEIQQGGGEDSEAGKLRLLVAGADMLDGTPIYDIKPYLPYGDIIQDATGGYTETQSWQELTVEIPAEWEEILPPGKREGLRQILAQDPRGAYEKKPGHTYGMRYGDYDVKFTVEDQILTVTEIQKIV